MLKHFCELKFKNEQNLKTSLEMVRQCLCVDKELPVRVEAAVALQVLLVEQEKGKRSVTCGSVLNVEIKATPDST